MNMTVSIEIEKLKQTLLQSFSGQVWRIQSELEAQFRKAVEAFDIAAEVKSSAAPIIQDAIRYALQRAVSQAMEHEAVKEILYKAVLKALMENLKNDQ